MKHNKSEITYSTIPQNDITAALLGMDVMEAELLGLKLDDVTRPK